MGVFRFSCVSWWLLVTAGLLGTLAEEQEEQKGLACGPIDCAELVCWGDTGPARQQVYVPTSELWVTCDFSTAGGGWTVMQQRRDMSFDFSKTRSEYETGFGNNATFWLGLKHVSYMTSRWFNLNMTLRVELQVGDPPSTKYIEYTSFMVLDNKMQYVLILGKPIGQHSLPDVLTHNAGPFCTSDMTDNEFCKALASKLHTAWWFNPSGIKSRADLNAKMGQLYWTGVENITGTAMKFRPKSFAGGRRVCDKTCPNAGTCHRNATGRYYCECAQGFSGWRCENKTVARTGSPNTKRVLHMVGWVALAFGVLVLIGSVYMLLRTRLSATKHRQTLEGADNERSPLVPMGE